MSAPPVAYATHLGALVHVGCWHAYYRARGAPVAPPVGSGYVFEAMPEGARCQHCGEHTPPRAEAHPDHVGYQTSCPGCRAELARMRQRIADLEQAAQRAEVLRLNREEHFAIMERMFCGTEDCAADLLNALRTIRDLLVGRSQVEIRQALKIARLAISAASPSAKEKALEREAAYGPAPLETMRPILAVLEQARDMLPRVAQLLDGWHADGTAWSEYDESVRREVSALMVAVERIVGDSTVADRAEGA